MKADDLLGAITAYAAAVGLSPSTICLRAVGNPHLPKRLRAGGQCLPRTADKVRAYMKANPPKSAEQGEAA